MRAIMMELIYDCFRFLWTQMYSKMDTWVLQSKGNSVSSEAHKKVVLKTCLCILELSTLFSWSLCMSFPHSWAVWIVLNLNQTDLTLVIRHITRWQCTAMSRCRCMPPSVFLFIPKELLKLLVHSCCAGCKAFLIFQVFISGNCTFSSVAALRKA